MLAACYISKVLHLGEFHDVKQWGILGKAVQGVVRLTLTLSPAVGSVVIRERVCFSLAGLEKWRCCVGEVVATQGIDARVLLVRCLPSRDFCQPSLLQTDLAILVGGTWVPGDVLTGQSPRAKRSFMQPVTCLPLQAQTMGNVKPFLVRCSFSESSGTCDEGGATHT